MSWISTVFKRSFVIFWINNHKICKIFSVTFLFIVRYISLLIKSSFWPLRGSWLHIWKKKKCKERALLRVGDMCPPPISTFFFLRNPVVFSGTNALVMILSTKNNYDLNWYAFAGQRYFKNDILFLYLAWFLQPNYIFQTFFFFNMTDLVLKV